MIDHLRIRDSTINLIIISEKNMLLYNEYIERDLLLPFYTLKIFLSRNFWAIMESIGVSLLSSIYNEQGLKNKVISSDYSLRVFDESVDTKV